MFFNFTLFFSLVFTIIIKLHRSAVRISSKSYPGLRACANIINLTVLVTFSSFIYAFIQRTARLFTIYLYKNPLYPLKRDKQSIIYVI